MPLEYSKNLKQHEKDTHFKLGHDDSNYFMSVKRYQDLGDISAQYKAIRNQMTPTRTANQTQIDSKHDKKSERIRSNDTKQRDQSSKNYIPPLDSVERIKILKSINSS